MKLAIALLSLLSAVYAGVRYSRNSVASGHGDIGYGLHSGWNHRVNSGNHARGGYVG